MARQNKFENIVIQRIILHEVYKRGDSNTYIEPFYNDQLSELDIVAKDVLRKRIIKSMGNESRSLEMDIDDDGENSVCNIIKAYWNNGSLEEEFIVMSKLLTKRLAEIQDTKRYPGGIIVVLSGTVQLAKKFVCIIKAEKQGGFTAIDKDGSKILQYISDLLLTQNQKLQKMGAFICNTENEVLTEDIDAIIFDSNTDSSTSDSKAKYFYSDYLGLKFKMDSDVLTERFYKVSKKFILENEKIPEDERIEKLTNLLSYIRMDTRLTLNSSIFADMAFEDKELKDDYLQYARKNNVPEINIHKDTSMLGKKISQRNLVLDDEVKIQIPVEYFGKNVTIDKDDNNETVITIKGMKLNER